MNRGTGGYDPAHFAKLAAVEERHFWFRARVNVIRALVQRVVTTLPAGYRVMEVGCGTGNVLQTLFEVCREGLVLGLDRFHEGLQFARVRNPQVNLVQADASLCPFAAGFHLIGIFDVLEHIAEDRQVLGDLFSMLEPSGKLLITVPAHMELWSDFDTFAAHCRRYTLPELVEKLEAAGFTIDFASEYMSATLPVIWAIRRLRRNAKSDSETIAENAARELRVIPVVNGVLLRLLALEGRWLGRLKRLPKGSSIVALATRPPDGSATPK